MIYSFQDLTDEQAGKLIKIVFEYVNDKNPVIEDQLLKVAFTPIRLALKRDLEDWKKTCQKNRENGFKGGRPKTERLIQEPKKPNGYFENPTEPKKADSDSDSDSEKVKEFFSFKEIESEFFKEKPMKRPYFIRMVELHSLPINEIQKLFSEWKIKNEGKQMTINHAENSFNLYIKGNKKILEALTDPNLPSVKYPKSTFKDNDF